MFSSPLFESLLFLLFLSLFASFSVDFDNSLEHFISRAQQDGPDAVWHRRIRPTREPDKTDP